MDSGSRCPGSSPGRVIALCSWARHFILTVPLSIQEYKWVPANCQGNLTKCWEVTCDGLVSHSGGVAILLVASCYGNRDKFRQSRATRLVRLQLCTLNATLRLTIVLVKTLLLDAFFYHRAIHFRRQWLLYSLFYHCTAVKHMKTGGRREESARETSGRAFPLSPDPRAYTSGFL